MSALGFLRWFLPPLRGMLLKRLMISSWWRESRVRLPSLFCLRGWQAGDTCRVVPEKLLLWEALPPPRETSWVSLTRHAFQPSRWWKWCLRRQNWITSWRIFVKFLRCSVFSTGQLAILFFGPPLSVSPVHSQGDTTHRPPEKFDAGPSGAVF